MRFACFALPVLSALVAARAEARMGAGASPGCVETSAIVGERRCSRFGDGWAVENDPRVFSGAGAWVSRVLPVGDKFGGKLLGTPYSARDFLLGSIVSYGFDLRVGGFLSRVVYMGATFGLAGGHAEASGFAIAGYALAPQDGLNFTHTRVGPLMGMRAQLGRMSVRVEVLGAIQAMQLKYFEIEPSGYRRERAMGGVSFVIEPRAAWDYWLTPRSTVSLWGGLDVLHPSNASFGVAYVSHFRAFDGAL